MNNQGMNGYLKDSEILTILPASADTRAETSIAWYEVQVYTAERRTLVNARDINGGNIATMEVKLLAANEVSISIEEQNVVQLKHRLALMRDDIGNTQIQVRSHDGDDISITCMNLDTSSARASGTRRLVGGEQNLSKHWERLIDPLITLADAMKVRAIDSHSWGCTSCLLLGAGMSLSAGACAGGGLAACGGALVAAGALVENCVGSCK